MARPPKHAVTVDVLEYFQAPAFRDLIVPAEWGSLPGRVVRSVENILHVFRNHGTRATFFFDPWIAKNNPSLAKKVADEGHEIGHLTLAGRASTPPLDGPGSVLDHIKSLRESSGKSVIGHRCQRRVSLRQLQHVADLLIQNGIQYDSSLCPRHCEEDVEPETLLYPFSVTGINGALVELPLPTLTIPGLAIPVARGFSLRNAPYPLTRGAVQRLESHGRPVVLRIKSWEVDPYQPQIPSGFLRRIQHYAGLDRTLGILERLLKDFRFGPAGELPDRHPCPRISSRTAETRSAPSPEITQRETTSMTGRDKAGDRSQALDRTPYPSYPPV